MQALLFLLIWVAVAFGIFFAAFYLTRSGEKPKYRGDLSGGVRGLVALAAIFIVVGVPLLVLSKTSDRLPSGAGTYTVAASKTDQDGRAIFRETCASCHSLDAANARGVYGPNLDAQLGTPGADPKATAARVEGAIKLGGATGKQMPKNLLQGRDARLVSQYVASVAGK